MRLLIRFKDAEETQILESTSNISKSWYGKRKGELHGDAIIEIH